jgi:N-methylhydantoinase A
MKPTEEARFQMSDVFSLGIDIGGTFTDFTLYNHRTGEVLVEKVLTTPGAPYEAVFSGIELLGKKIPQFLASASRVNHATTLVTNAILERKGVPTALITTKGFRDVLETRLENRYDVYDLAIRFPQPIVARENRFGVSERMYSDGAVRTPLSDDEVKEVGDCIRRRGLKAVAICFLHSYRNAEHEQRAAQILREALPDVTLSVSHEVSPEPREYQRSSTTVLDAYVKPVVNSYLGALESGLAKKGYGNTLEIMLSNGGSTTSQNARGFPIQMIESGPAAGVEASSWTCKLFDIHDALSFDMGGTTAKLCILRNGIPERARKFEAAREHRFVAGSGLPVTVPVYDLVEIGAGGGSIAGLDNLDLLSVGPESASSVPGPACYGRGGANPTVTDADLILGYLDPEYFLGGDMQLNLKAAYDAIDAKVAQPLGISVENAAYAIVDVVNETMAAAARLHIAEKGCDPRKLTLIAFGGAGPLHALELGRKLGCPAVVFPPYAGVMSSLGLLTAPPAFERMKAVRISLDEANHTEISGHFMDVRDEVVRIIGEQCNMQFRYVAELWYHGQEYPLEIQLQSPPSSANDVSVMRRLFFERYREFYGRVDDDNAIEVVALRVIGSFGNGVTRVTVERGREHRFGKRRVYDYKRETFIEVNVVSRDKLVAGEIIVGPIIIQDRESGVVIREGDRLSMRENGAIFVELGTAA